MICHPRLSNLPGRFAGNQFADGVFDDVADDVFGRVIDAASLADFGLFLQPGAFVGGDDDLAEKAFVDAAEDVDGNGVEIVGRIEMGQSFADAGEGFVVQLEAGGVEDFVLFIDDAVVDAVEPAGFGDEILPGGALVAEIGDAVLRFDVFVFASGNSFLCRKTISRLSMDSFRDCQSRPRDCVDEPGCRTN